MYPRIFQHCFWCKQVNPPVTTNAQEAIPKIIHYCWFGQNPDTELKIKCIESWKKYCPDYELRLWNEDNFPIEKYPFAQRAYADKKWAYVADAARFHAMYYHGGIYMDTDVEVMQPLDRFLEEDFFSGYDTAKRISAGTMGSRAGNKYLWFFLSWYAGKQYSRAFYNVPVVRILSKFTKLYYGVKLDGQEFYLPDGAHFYPAIYFCGHHRDSHLSECYTIHHGEASWVEKKGAN